MLTCAIPAKASEKNDPRARSLTLFKESAAHYQEGRYAVAAALLEEAYAIHPEPKLLYNLGRAREAAGDSKGALNAYEAFLREDAASDRRPEVELRIAQLRSTLSPPASDEGAATPSAPPDDTKTSVPTTSRNAADSSSEGAGVPRYVPWTLLSSGVAVLGAAAVLGVVAGRQERDADREPVQAEAVELQDKAERKALAANVLFGAGGALTLTGIAWLWLGARKTPPASASASFAPRWDLRVSPSSVACIVRY